MTTHYMFAICNSRDYIIPL